MAPKLKAIGRGPSSRDWHVSNRIAKGEAAAGGTRGVLRSSTPWLCKDLVDGRRYPSLENPRPLSTA